MIAAAHAMALLRFLFSALKDEHVLLAEDGEINFKIIGPRQTEPQFFRVAADLIVIHGQSGP